jgi:hypothetical protein
VQTASSRYPDTDTDTDTDAARLAAYQRRHLNVPGYDAAMVPAAPGR